MRATDKHGKETRLFIEMMALDRFQGGDPNRRILPPRRQVHGEKRREFPRDNFRKTLFRSLWTLCELGVLAIKFLDLQKTDSSPWDPSRAKMI
jgi:hypothetical protein